jgi:long-chain acyl-CoA synthetase
MIFLDKKITYRELDLLINKFAALLLDLGVKKGDFVAPMLPNTPQHWVVFYSAARIGAIHAPLNVMYKQNEISYQISDCGAKTVVTLDLFYPYFKELKGKLNIDNIIVTNIKDFASPNFEVYASLKPFWDYPKNAIEGTIDFAEAIEKYQPTKVKADINPRVDPAQIVYTAGTTGQSKGALQTHLNLVHNSITHSLICKCTGRLINYCVLPMFHTGGFLLFPLPTFYRGGTIIPRPIFDPEDAMKVIQKYKVNVMFGSPTLYVAFLRHPKLKEYDLSSLETTLTGAAPVPNELVKAWNGATGMPLVIGWGMTELNTAGTFNMMRYRSNPSSIGLPLVGEVKIVDKDNVVPRGQEGEIYYRGLQVSKGYFNKPEETKEAFQSDGWLRTGDAGYIDEDGFLHFTDRKKDLIIASGYNIAPVEIEYTIIRHPAVLEVAVVGVPDEYRGETVKAFVVLKDEFKGKTTDKDIINFCKENIATHKVPRMVEFINELPKNLLGKTLRRVLRDRELQKG